MAQQITLDIASKFVEETYIERVSAAYWAKYPRDPGTKGMVAADALDTTLRLEPT